VGPAVELWVELFAQPPDRLSDRDPRREGVRDGEERDSLTATREVAAQAAHRDRAPDAEPALPDVKGGPGVLAGREVELRVGDDVVEPGPDQPERYGPDRDVP